MNDIDKAIKVLRDNYERAMKLEGKKRCMK